MGYGFMECPEEGCDQAAEIEDVYTLESTDGPVRHIRVRCVLKHSFDMPEIRNWCGDLPPLEVRE